MEHMRFKHHHGGVTKKNRRFVRGITLFLACAMFAAGIYLLILVMTPNIPVLFPVERIDAKTLPAPTDDRVYIPKIGVSVPLVAGGAEALEKGAWHRFPERGDPVEGGNFIISAHRFSLGATPGETRKKSPFYHIDKLEVGDQIIVDFHGKRYGYEVTEKTNVKPTQVEIEAPITDSEDARLTLYTCTLGGESDGREVFYAKPLGEVNKDGMIAI
jgi:sortase A